MKIENAVGVLRKLSDACLSRRLTPAECDDFHQALASLEAAEGCEVRSGYRATVHELLTNIKRACIRGRSARQTDNNLIATCDHIENMADEAMSYFAPPAAASDGEGIVDKHTPGPWRYSEVIGGCFIYAGSRQAVPEGPLTDSKRCRDLLLLAYTSSPDPENKANARLIAAAPELLEALVAARAELEECERQLTGESYNNLSLNAAIAKATGATP